MKCTLLTSPTVAITKALWLFFHLFVSLQDGHARRSAPLLITTEEEERLFEEGRRRYEAHKKQKMSE